ncbi:MAG: hypothetical protein IIV16_04125 [Alistipes sp.]|nr:hypothetical protein [Alistipes sp.]
MKLRVLYILLVAVVAFTACSVGDTEIPSPSGTVISVELSDSRTSLGESVEGKRAVYWSSGDCIVANGEVSGEAQISGEQSAVADFAFAATLGYPRNILYPASLYADDATITLLRVQDFAEGTVATNTLPMATTVANSGESVKLHHLAAVVHLQLKASTAKNNAIRKVEIRGRANEQMSGEFTIDYNTATLTPTVIVPPTEENTDNNLALVTGSRVLGELSADEVTDVFVVVPAQVYAEGFTVRVINEYGHYMDKEKTSGVTLSKGEIYKLPVIAFEPTGTIIKVEL